MYTISRESFDCPCCDFNDWVDVAICSDYADLDRAVGRHVDSGYPAYVRIPKKLVKEYHRIDKRLDAANESEKGARKGIGLFGTFFASIIYSVVKGVSAEVVRIRIHKEVTNGRDNLVLPRYRSYRTNSDGSITIALGSLSEFGKKTSSFLEFI